MTVAEIQQLSLREKLQIMEVIWEDLRETADQLALPQEHQRLLDARRERAASGKAVIFDWDQVKSTIGSA